MGKRIKAPVAYMGGKQKLARKIAELLPPSQLYIEPFCDMCSVFLAREPVSKTNVLNDKEKRVVHYSDRFRPTIRRCGRCKGIWSISPVWIHRHADRFSALRPPAQKPADVHRYATRPSVPGIG